MYVVISVGVLRDMTEVVVPLRTEIGLWDQLMILTNSSNNRDEFTGFRDFLRRIKRRNYEYDVDLEYLKKVWDSCNVCVYSGVKLTLPTHIQNNNPLVTASIDRIDSTKGYVKGNIQYISITANHAKNSMSHEQMLEFCGLIIENKKPIV